MASTSWFSVTACRGTTAVGTAAGAGSMAIEDEEAAQAEAMRRFSEKAEELKTNFEERFLHVLPGNHSPAESVLLAHLMTCTDGYEDVRFIYDWNRRPKFGTGTIFSYLPDLSSIRAKATFAFECLYGEVSNQLAVLIDFVNPGERLPFKIDNESRLRSFGFRVIQFTELEILSAPDACRERVEGVLWDMQSDLWLGSESEKPS
ncbi:hypothetical protein LJE71_21670 [Xanthobacter autotrophicus]|uniref:hypothetical protein n=1 Tax=Xanthobacter autotrophicus TaxID=280 RepID=UPI001E550709|nr:hypothetical protein [Xanthobacter autotrophicus]UDQ88806.1 hypothetical protein LJE71_21670 [Xanthobacter autotrophicus]